MSEEDIGGSLDSNPYSWQERKDEVRISWKGRVVTVLRKESAMKFLERISQACAWREVDAGSGYAYGA